VSARWMHTLQMRSKRVPALADAKLSPQTCFAGASHISKRGGVSPTDGESLVDRSYERLSLFYDRLMQGIDYEAWVGYIEGIVSRYGGRVGVVADLACGTGNSSFPWSDRGYRTYGVDLSAEMLEIARVKAAARGLDITFLRQDLCSLRLEAPVDLAVCFQDGFNYIIDIEDLRRAFQSVYKNLTAGGFFIFDLNYLPRIVPPDQSVSLVQEDGFTLSWSAEYKDEEMLWEIEARGTIEDGDGNRHDYLEKHLERIYEPHEIWSLLTAQGFTGLNSFQAFTFEQPHDRTLRIVYVAQKV
jgi:SAM-dependent methyltransferase